MLLNLFKKLMIVFLLLISFAPATVNAQEVQVQLGANATVAERQARTDLGEEIRRRLITQPFYDVFDWLEGELKQDGTLVLRGAVTRPTLKTGAESSVSDLAGVKQVINEIEVLPVSPYDDRLRNRIYRAIYNFNSPLFRYAVRAVPPIHIIVKGGRVTLKGAVATAQESRLAEIYARQVPGTFEVKNELRVEQERKL
jgi:hyperosmotically inducible periplasmic protein